MTVDPVSRFLLAVALVLLVCHACGELMRLARQPPVLGEILGGLLLGPSALGVVWPGFGPWLFTPDVLDALDRAAQLGLVMFMFVLGCELSIDRIHRPRTVGVVALGSMGLPFLAGAAVAVVAARWFADGRVPAIAYVLFVGLALAITALPVLARILVELRLDRTDVGVLALSAAAVGDAAAWLTLTLILAVTGAGGEAGRGVGPVLAVALVAALFPVLRRALRFLVARVTAERLLTAILVSGAIAFSAGAHVANLHPVIGAFLFGVALPRNLPVVERLSRQVQGFTLMVLLPLFFAKVGLSSSVALLGADPGPWLLFAGVLVVAQVTKIVGAGAAARMAGLPGPKALQLGVLMNCRGVTELVVATIGLQYHIISTLAFTMLVLVAVITTAVTAPLMQHLIRADAAAARRACGRVSGARPDIRRRLVTSVRPASVSPHPGTPAGFTGGGVMKGIVLAGGNGTRMHPLTLATSKQLLAVYDKPLVYYPVSVLMLAGVRDILMISTPTGVPALQALFCDGSQLGLNISYAVQPEPRGIAEAFIIGADHIGDGPSALILGDNIFHGAGFPDLLRTCRDSLDGCTLFGYPVSDPQRYGVGAVDSTGALVSIEEKPPLPRSDNAITGLYFYDAGVVEIARSIVPSPRDELEITDVNLAYLKQGRARLVRLGRGFTWFDAGTQESLLDASQYVHGMERRQGVRVACLEEIALRMGYIDAESCYRLGARMKNSEYGRYVMDVAQVLTYASDR